MASPGMSVAAPDHILLTGATGVLGAHLLKELLETTRSTIHCLVRAEHPGHAAQRLLSILRAYDPEGRLLEAFRARVRPVVGEVSQPLLGLDPVAYAAFAETIDAIVHMAACTKLFFDFERLSPVNVGGTQNVIDFALKTRRRYLCYVSTYTVMGDKTFDPSCVFRETDLDLGQGFEHLAYQESKFRAERLVRQARERGLVWNILRPGQVFGESRTGCYPHDLGTVSMLFYDIFKTIIETGVALHSQAHYDITPVDYVSRASVFLALGREAFFQTYHLTNPDVKTYFQVVNLVRDLGYPIEILPIPEYRDRLFERRLLKDGKPYSSLTLKAFRFWLSRERFDFRSSAVTDCSLTRLALAPEGIHCPRIDSALLGTYLRAGVRTGYFPEPRRALASSGALP